METARDLALAVGEMELSIDCATKAGDLSGLLLMYTAYGDRERMSELMKTARAQGKFNVAFAAAYTLGEVDTCVDMLWRWDACPRLLFLLGLMYPPELLRLYCWKDDLEDFLSCAGFADPDQYPEDFLTFLLL